MSVTIEYETVLAVNLLGRSQIEAYCFWMPDCSFSEPRRESRPLPLFSNECSNDRKVSSRKIASPKGNKHKHNCAESVRKEVDNIQNRGRLNDIHEC